MVAKGTSCLVGLTGGLASGKSTVAGLLSAQGIPVRDADRIVHDLYSPGGAGALFVAQRFGREMIDEGGAVDRKALAAVISMDEGARKELESAIHPLVREEIAEWVARQDSAIVVVEAALLIETGSAAGYDVLVGVCCGREEQRRRAKARGMALAQVDAILGLQVSDEIRRARADVIIENSGPREDLPAEAARAWDEVCRRCEALQAASRGQG